MFALGCELVSIFTDTEDRCRSSQHPLLLAYCSSPFPFLSRISDVATSLIQQYNVLRIHFIAATSK